MFDRVRTVVQTITRALGYVGMWFIVPMMLLTSADATGLTNSPASFFRCSCCWGWLIGNR